jgi:hypothetical protein
MKRSLSLLGLLALGLAAAAVRGEVTDDGASFLLNNGKGSLPLVGFGVGNLPHEKLPEVGSPLTFSTPEVM